MNKLTIAVMATAALTLAAGNVNLKADTATNAPPTPLGFVTQAGIWATSFNTNAENSWDGTVLEVAIGADYQDGTQWANDIDGQWDVNGGKFNVGARMRNEGILNTVMAYEGKVGYAIWSHYDFRIEAEAYGGYDLVNQCPLFEPQFNMRKKVAPYAFLGLYLGEPIRVGNSKAKNQWVPNIGIETGFTGGTAPLTSPAVAMRVHVDHTVSWVRRHLDPHSL